MKIYVDGECTLSVVEYTGKTQFRRLRNEPKRTPQCRTKVDSWPHGAAPVRSIIRLFRSVNLGCQVSSAEAIVDVDHGHTRSAAVQHAQ